MKICAKFIAFALCVAVTRSAYPDAESEYDSEPAGEVVLKPIERATFIVNPQPVVSTSSVLTVVASVEPAKEAVVTESPTVSSFAAELENAASVDVPNIVAAALAKADTVHIAPILKVALENITEAEAPAVAAALYAALVRATVKDVQPTDLVKIQTEWYERFHAVGGSKLYWILRVARERAEKGEDVSQLKAAFDATMNRWLKEE